MLEQEKEKEIKELDEWMKSILDGRELKIDLYKKELILEKYEI